MDRETLERIKANPENLIRFVARQRFVTFARYINPKLQMTNFHNIYYEVLDRFAHGRIKKLIVSVPPQHGKTEGSSRFLPAFLLGLNPDLKIVICSYNADQARSFKADVARIVSGDAYKAVFPDTYFTNARTTMDNVYKNNAEVGECVGHRGFVRAVGRSGALTGKSVDISILDDVYKDFNEANSPLIREQSWKWYTTVVRTRLHNDSQELIVFTRWHEDDLIGRIEKSGEPIVELKTWDDIDNVPKDAWLQINFPALKVGEPTELDPRHEGEALWEERHSRKKLLEAKALDPIQFECLFQGNPSSSESRLYGEFKTYTDKDEYGVLIRKGCVVDVADKGTDYLCSICYEIRRSPNTIYNEKAHRFEPLLYALVTDVLFTQEGTEVTSISVPMQINTQGVQKVWIESNSGGQIFSQNIAKKVKAQVAPFFSGGNKESRIVSNASGVMQSIVFPLDWEVRWESFAKQLTHFMRTWASNLHDDAPDCVSMLYVKEIADGNVKPYRNQRRGISRKN